MIKYYGSGVTDKVEDASPDAKREDQQPNVSRIPDLLVG
jgi:hypothetical protein